MILMSYKLFKEFPLYEIMKSEYLPERTSAWCFHCCHPFTTPPLGLPIRKTTDEFITTGIFCSIPCMKTYNLEQNTSSVSERFNMIEHMRAKIGAPKGFAPRREELHVFGGALSIEEFRRGTTLAPRTKYTVPMKMLKSDIDNLATFSVHNKSNSIPVTESENEPLKLQRSSTQANQNTLETAMGLFKT